LGGGVLNRHNTLGKARQIVHRHCAAQYDCIRLLFESFYIDSFQCLYVERWSAFLLVYSEHHGCLDVVGAKYLLPLQGPLFLHALDPPGRVIPLREQITSNLRHQGLTLAQKAPQTGIDE